MWRTVFPPKTSHQEVLGDSKKKLFWFCNIFSPVFNHYFFRINHYRFQLYSGVTNLHCSFFLGVKLQWCFAGNLWRKNAYGGQFPQNYESLGDLQWKSSARTQDQFSPSTSLVRDEKEEAASRLNTPKLLQLISANFLWWKDMTSDKREWNVALLFWFFTDKRRSAACVKGASESMKQERAQYMMYRLFFVLHGAAGIWKCHFGES